MTIYFHPKTLNLLGEAELGGAFSGENILKLILSLALSIKENAFTIPRLKRICRIQMELNLSSIRALKIVKLGDDKIPDDDDENEEQPYNFTVRFDPAILTTIIVLFCIFCFIAIISIFIRRRRANLQVGRAFRRADVGNWAAAEGLDRTVIESFPVFKYSRVKGLKAQACTVCLADFKEPEMLRLLPNCIHAFHPECIDKWLFSHTTCPVCRTCLLPGGDSDFIGVQLQPTGNGERVSNDEATNGASTGRSLLPSTSNGPSAISKPSDEDQRSRSDRSGSISVHMPSLARSSSERTAS